MKKFLYDQEPLKMFGVPFLEQTKRLERLPEEVRTLVPNLSCLGRRVPGARLCFRTNSPKVVVNVGCEKRELELGLSIFQCQSSPVFIGDRTTSRYVGLVYPSSYDDTFVTGTFQKSNELEDIVIYLPQNPVVTFVSIEVEDDSVVLPPTPYRYEKPILYYGSSITECGITLVSNCYSSIISRWLDVDFYNFGFSGNAKGELIVADYINTIEKSIFVYDYDHNAKDSTYLEQTHEPFFKRIREHDPELPIVMMSRPDFHEGTDDVKRREVIRKTYENAVSAGDKNVYFIDGATFFGKEDRELCTIDTCHPNDLGHYRMAKTICPVLRKILEEQGDK